jgi:hypothetical protein
MCLGVECCAAGVPFRARRSRPIAPCSAGMQASAPHGNGGGSARNWAGGFK